MDHSPAVHTSVSEVFWSCSGEPPVCQGVQMVDPPRTL